MTKKRNPFAAQLQTNRQFRPKVAKSALERAKHRDGWERVAKYKTTALEIEAFEEGFQIGDEVSVPVEVEQDGEKRTVTKKGMIKNPKAPLGMVGLTVDGQYELVQADKVKLIAESLARMIELSK